MPKKKTHRNLSSIEILFRSEEVLSDDLKEDVADWLFQSVHEFFDDNESPCEIDFAVLINGEEIKIH